MKKNIYEDYLYLCNANILFEYMEEGFEVAINSKYDFKGECIDGFCIFYNGYEYRVGMFLNYNGDNISPYVLLDNKKYNSMDDFKENAKLGEFLIREISDNFEVYLINHSSVFLDENEITDDKPINKKEFKYDDGYIKAFFYCAVFFGVVAIIGHCAFIGQTGGIIGIIFFDLTAIFQIYIYFYYKKKKIIYHNGTFDVYGIIGKKEYKVEDIESVSASTTITIKMKNDDKFKVDCYMNNYRYVERILKQKGIEISKIPIRNYFEINKKK